MTAAIILALVTLQRLAELLYARRNTARLLAQGAREEAAGHYPLIVALHGFWLASIWLLAPGRPIDWLLLGLFTLLQIARLWVLATLGSRWTTRIIVVPGAPLVRRGPYRWLHHPNYWIVVLEIAILPLAFGLAWTALIFSLANAALLSVRIRKEEEALRRSALPTERMPS